MALHQSQVSREHEKDRIARVLILAAACYRETYCSKEPCRDSALSGAKWISELKEENPTQIFQNLRMTKSVFAEFCREILVVAQESPWAQIGVDKLAAIFLYCISRKSTNRDLQERFQRSGETIRRCSSKRMATEVKHELM